MRLFRKRKPVEPEGVRITRANGEVVECELVYEGRDDDKIDVWTITIMMQQGDKLSVDVWPAKCGIQGKAAEPPPGTKFDLTWREGGPDGPERTQSYTL
jgi:hypothetical protein